MVTERTYDPQSLKHLRSRPLAKARHPCSAPWSGPSLCGGLGAELRLSSQVCVDTRSHACSKSRVAMSCLRGCPPGPGPTAAWTTSLLVGHCPVCPRTHFLRGLISATPVRTSSICSAPSVGAQTSLCPGLGVLGTQRV